MRALKIIPIAAIVFSSLALASDPGQRPFNAKCASCHGKDGKGQTEQGKAKHVRDLTDPAVQAALTDDQIATAIVDGISEKGREMKGFKGQLTDEQVKAIVAYVRTFKK
jgi:mono/diheme cytochrome c family protein